MPRTPTFSDLQPIVELPEKKPEKKLSLWLVAAYDSLHGNWKLFKEKHTSEDRAREFASRLHPLWQHRQLFHLVDKVVSEYCSCGHEHDQHDSVGCNGTKFVVENGATASKRCECKLFVFRDAP